jgi:hypothetical protein
VFIDPLLLETVVTSLLSNALKYTEQGRITVRLSDSPTIPTPTSMSSTRGVASRPASLRRWRIGTTGRGRSGASRARALAWPFPKKCSDFTVVSCSSTVKPQRRPVERTARLSRRASL